MKLNHLRALTILPLLALGSITSQAASVLTYTGTGTNSSQATGDFTIGSRFQVNVSGLSVTQLGVMDTTGSGTLGTDGFATTGEVSVGIWSWNPLTSTAVLLASTTVGDADPLI